MPDVRLLLLSNSSNTGSGYLDHARVAIRALSDGQPVVFLPFALDNWDDYTDQVRRALPGIDVIGAHHHGAIADTVLNARTVFAGGGNTFRLLDALQQLDLAAPLANRVRSGKCAYIGSSAGTNVACPTIRTTNDMPIVPVASLTALGLVPFQINPHFTDALPPELMVETRRDRIAQFLERSATPVLGLREGAWLYVDNHVRKVGGTNGAIMFTREAPVDLHAGDSVDPWWLPPVFDDQAPSLRT